MSLYCVAELLRHVKQVQSACVCGANTSWSHSETASCTANCACSSYS